MSSYESRGGPALPAPLAKRSRWRRAALWLGPLLTLLVLQSVTITFPIEVQFVDEDSGEPLADLPVTAVWELDAVTLAGSHPTDAIGVREYVTDEQGRLRVEAAFMLHTPILPFDFLMRSPESLPALIVTDERVYPRAFTNDIANERERAPLSVFSFRRSSLDGDILPLRTRAIGPDADASSPEQSEFLRKLLLWRVDQARAWCSEHRFCSPTDVGHGQARSGARNL
ncbi:MAG TPA: hypothetical protein VF161_12495 [Steroidobacteraceae bacterium]